MSRSVPLIALGLVVTAMACTDGGPGADGPRIVATTSILGDVVEHIVGDGAEVVTVMPPGADPHEFQPSAREAAELREADLVVANGLGFEAGLSDALETAEADGAEVYEVAPDLDPLGDDPHVFTDPVRMADAVGLIADELGAASPELDTAAVRRRADGYAEEIRAASAEIDDDVSVVPDDRRKLVTNHEVFAYFAERYGFEVIGTVIPGGGTGGEPSAAELGDLAETVREERVPVIFADVSSPSALADTLAAEAGVDVEVVELFSESLGEPGSGGETYLEMMRTNAQRIASGLSRGSGSD